jgi:outer membrane lipoprotein-sorting protein
MSIGGVEKWRALKTMKLTGVVPTPQGEFTFEMSRKAPNKMLVTADVMGQKIIPQAYDGEVAWMLNPFAGSQTATKMSEQQTKDLMRDAAFEDPFIDFASKGFEVTYEGTADVEGIQCHVLKLVRNKGQGADESSSTYYFDPDSFLPLMTKLSVYTEQMGSQEVEIYYSDYQDIGNGLLMPYTMDTRANGASVQNIKFTKVVVDEEIADEVFKYPGE